MENYACMITDNSGTQITADNNVILLDSIHPNKKGEGRFLVYTVQETGYCNSIVYLGTL